jgi:8-oxo-dGTP pyrophosphatase MutT (NUDIX family)
VVNDLEERIRRNLAGFDRIAADDGALRRAAVAITVLDGPRVLIAKRVPRGLNAGQWALPGGKLNAGEDALTAALRELHEEAGLAIEPAAVAGVLDDVVTDSGFCIPLANLEAEHVPRWARTPDGRPLLQMPLRHDMVIHAPTGAILLQFREVALRGRMLRVDDLAQPEWTRV